MRETHFLLIGTFVVATGMFAVAIDGADRFRVATAVAAIVSLLATAARPPSHKPNRWPKYIGAISVLAILIVFAFFVLPHFLSAKEPRPAPDPKPTRTPTPSKKPKRSGMK